jgi:hypothetical protein
MAPRDNPQIAGVIFAEHGEHGSTAAIVAKHALDTFFAKREGRPLPPPPPVKGAPPPIPPEGDDPPPTRIAQNQEPPGSPASPVNLPLPVILENPTNLANPTNPDNRSNRVTR